MSPNLDDKGPEEAVEKYLSERETDGASEWTVRSHRSRLGHFLNWCQMEGVESMADLRAGQLGDYKDWRAEEDLAKVTLKTQLDTLRVFIRWCESYDYVPKGMDEAVRSPSISKSENVRDKDVEPGTCEAVLTHLRKYCYASRAHVVYELAWHATLRRGAIHALDVEDFDREAQTLSLTHREESETPLKNKKESERVLNLTEEVTEVIADWIDDQRPDITDEYGRRPLIATNQGRAVLGTIAADIYDVTRPEFRGEKCSCSPSEDDGWESCPVTCTNNAYRCEDSVSPHTVRAASITHHLDNGWMIEMVADRADNSPDVIRDHYDNATEQEKAERRAEFMGLLGDGEDDEEEGEGSATATV